MIDRVLPLIQKRDFKQRFSIDLLFKDMGIAIDMGNQILVPLSLAKLAEKMIAEAKEQGYGHEDIAAIIKPVEKRSHIEVK